MKTRASVLVGTIAAAMLSGCLVVPGRHGKPMLLAPPLPALVVLESEPYYVQSGYHYHYQNDNWYYSKSRG